MMLKFRLTRVSSLVAVDVTIVASGEGSTVTVIGITEPVREFPSFSVVTGRTDKFIVPL